MFHSNMVGKRKIIHLLIVYYNSFYFVMLLVLVFKTVELNMAL